MRIVFARTQREAYRLRAELLPLPAVADCSPEQIAANVSDIAAAMQPRSDDDALDIGAGDGSLSIRLATEVRRAVALDLSPRSLQRIRHSCPETARPWGTAGLCQALPFAEGAFSIVILNGVIYALPSAADTRRAIGEAFRVLRPGGRAYFGSIPVADERNGARPAEGRLRRARAKIQRHGLRRSLRVLWERRHQKVLIVAPDTFLYFSPADFTAMLQGCGFSLQQVTQTHAPGTLLPRLNYIAVRPG